MAPRKRSRRDEDEDEIIAVGSASSSLRQDAQRKKVRTSNNNPKGRNARQEIPSMLSIDEDEDDDEELPDAEDHGPAPPPTSQYELLRDGDWGHLENPDRDDQRATQRFLARNQLIGDNHAAQNSIIQEITCINFMCHDKLHVELGPLINFIVGMNGSGKSAVLTAITLCLGAKSSSTNRGNSMKSLVKTGRDQAILIIKLKNQGNDAYQPDVYGESIIVERHFSSTGSGSYKVKNALGRVISNKKGDVDDIVEYFQLQVDNPMNVLTQDAAKSFITHSTPRQKYEFFVKGVQLEALDRDYKLVSETCDSIEVKLSDSKKDIKALQKLSEAALAKSELVKRHEGMRRQARNLSKQTAWAQVEAEEKTLVAREAKVAIAQENINRQERTAEDKDAAFQRTDELWEQAKEAEERVTEETEPLKEAVENAKAAHEAARQDATKAHAEQRQIGLRMREDREKVKTIQRDIEAELKRIEDVNGGSHTMKLVEIEEARQVAITAKGALEENERGLPGLEERHRGLQAEVKKYEGPLATKRNEVEGARKRLDDLNGDRGNVMAGYEPNMSKLLLMIRNDNGFREKPVGPMGLHIKLLDPSWSDVLESTIGQNLSGFVVTSKFDQLRLSGMMRQLQIQFSPILIGNHSPINTSGHEPDPQLQTVLRVLEIDNDLIKWQLIINQGIDQSILVKKADDAEKVMYHGPRPRNVKQCFVINEKKRGWGHRMGFSGRSGDNRDMGPIRPPRGKPRMKTDIETRIQYQRETLTQLQRELADLENSKREAERSTKTLSQEITRHKRAYGNLKIDSQRADDRMDALQTALEREDVEDGRLQALNDDLGDAEQTVFIDEEAYGNSGLEKDTFNRVSIEKKRELDAVKLRMDDQAAKAKKAHIKVRKFEQARNIALQEKNHAIHLIEELKGAKEALEASRDRQIARVADFTRSAGEICERVPIDQGETLESIETKLKKLMAQLDKYKKQQGGEDQEIHEAAVVAQERYETAKEYQTELIELLGLLKQSFMKRINMYRRFQQHISARSRINFNYLLSERAFRGKLSIDHKAKQLDVHVEPDETTKSSKGRQTKTLSGGEKSFSNICLLLSLWEAMGAPLRCLDEFDVFMDDVNRDVSSKMIISAARRSVGRQFILITPKALGAGVADAEDVKIIKLFDPRDKQRRINEMVNGV